jgi:hypothetical protein
MHRWLATQRAQGVEHEHGDVGVELFAVFGHAKVAAVHGAGGCAQAAAAGVLKAFAGLEQGLLAHHAQAFDLVVAAIGIINAPGARDQLGGDGAGVRDGDGVGKGVHALLGGRLVGQVLGLNLDAEFVSGHGGMVQGCGGVAQKSSAQQFLLRHSQWLGLAAEHQGIAILQIAIVQTVHQLATGAAQADHAYACGMQG